MPSIHEWHAVATFHGTSIYFGEAQFLPNREVQLEFCGIKLSVRDDYFSTGNGIGYALRFKQGSFIPYPDFPPAPDNSMACAYRYQRLGSGNTARLKVQCVYVGNIVPLPDLKTVIARESWWNAHASETITREFAMFSGRIDPAIPSTSAGKLVLRGERGLYWSATTPYSGAATYAYAMRIFTIGISTGNTENSEYGYSVRLFSDE